MFDKYKPQGATFTLKSKVHKLSGGQQRMVSIIAALCLRKDANVLFLIISHCKIFPFINKIACFGMPDESGFYR